MVLWRSGSPGGRGGTTKSERGRVERWEVEDGGGHGGTTKSERGRVEIRKVDRTTEKGRGEVEIGKVDGGVGHVETTKRRRGNVERSRNRRERGPSKVGGGERWGRLAILKVPSNGSRAGQRIVDFGI